MWSVDDETSQAEARVGRVLSEKWRLDRLLGVGGMAAVYEATHRNGMRAAVKVLHASLSCNAEARHRFLSEGVRGEPRPARAGVVTVLDDDEAEDGAAFLVMELAGRGDARGPMVTAADGGCRCTRRSGSALCLLEALDAAHAAGVVHRDVKPENVFVTTEGAIKLLDFGIARVREISLSSQRTQAGVAMGTPSFMPPEQARGRWDEVDARSDVWSLGATLFTLLSGRHVHDGETPNETLLRAMTAAAPSLGSVWSGAPPGVVALVDRALAVAKSERWPSAQAMLAAIHVEEARLLGTGGPSFLVCRGSPGDGGETVAARTALAVGLSMRGASRLWRAFPPRSSPASSRRSSRSSWVRGGRVLAPGQGRPRRLLRPPRGRQRLLRRRPRPRHDRGRARRP